MWHPNIAGQARTHFYRASGCLAASVVVGVVDTALSVGSSTGTVYADIHPPAWQDLGQSHNSSATLAHVAASDPPVSPYCTLMYPLISSLHSAIPRFQHEAYDVKAGSGLNQGLIFCCLEPVTDVARTHKH